MNIFRQLKFEKLERYASTISRILNALVHDGHDAGSWLIRQAKNCLNIDRNLSLGVLVLLSTYGPFLAQLYQDKNPLASNKKGADS